MQRQGFPLFCIFLNVGSINLPVKTHQDSTIQRRKTQASEHQVPAEALMIYDMVDTYRTWTSQLGPKKSAADLRPELRVLESMS
jgi:hypothetical protein